MILKKFPNLAWIQNQSKSHFADKKAYNNTQLNKKGWPSVVLNSASKYTEREHILGPFSIFVNLSGKSLIRTENRDFKVEEETYCITNSEQYYDLIIPQNTLTTTFNIHFGTQLFKNTIYSLSQKDDFLLDNPITPDDIQFTTFPRSVWKDSTFQFWIKKLIKFYDHDQSSNPNIEEEKLSDFLTYILQSNTQALKAAASIKSCKVSTRQELMRRVLIAVDYIHESYTTDISLNQLSEVAMLSKFHLQRTFKQVKGCTPNQYIAKIRLHKSIELLSSTHKPLSEISCLLGFSELSAFTRFFVHQLNTTPTQYRSQISNMGQMKNQIPL